MAADFLTELRRRMAFAFDRWQQRERKYPADPPGQTELGRRVAVRVKRAKPYTQTAVAGWLAGKIPREVRSADALASELGQEPGWLYFNRGVAPAGWADAHAMLVAHDNMTSRDRPTAKRKKA